eukprot:1255041-Rhodomonas_salina.1
MEGSEKASSALTRPALPAQTLRPLLSLLLCARARLGRLRDDDPKQRALRGASSASALQHTASKSTPRQPHPLPPQQLARPPQAWFEAHSWHHFTSQCIQVHRHGGCLLYTSDAADDM